MRSASLLNVIVVTACATPATPASDAARDARSTEGGTGGAGGTSAVGIADAGLAIDSGPMGGSGTAGNGDTGVGGTSGAMTDSGGAARGDADDPCGSGNPAVVPLPMIRPGMFDVTTYGALGDDKTDNTKALQDALTAAAANGGGTVVVPSGTYLSGPIVMSSGTRLELTAQAVLKMLPMSSYPGTTAFITADKAHDIALTGTGTIEGQGQAWWNALTAMPDLKRPQEVSFSNSTRVQIAGIRLQNSPEEHIWVKGDSDVTITGIKISTLPVAGQHVPNNTDGVDIGADGVFFCNNDIACGDDNVVMSGTNIYVAYSTFGVGHGCTIGSITSKGVSNVTVDHVTMNGTAAGIRMKSARDRGGLVQHLSYSNMTLTNVENPIDIASYYPKPPTDPSADPAQPVTASTPQWNDITIKNVMITGAANAGILWGLPEQKVTGVTLDNVQIQAATGMKIFHASGVSFINGSTVKVKSGAQATTFDAMVTGIVTTPF